MMTTGEKMIWAAAFSSAQVAMKGNPAEVAMYAVAYARTLLLIEPDSEWAPMLREMVRGEGVTLQPLAVKFDDDGDAVQGERVLRRMAEHAMESEGRENVAIVEKLVRERNELSKELAAVPAKTGGPLAVGERFVCLLDPDHPTESTVKKYVTFADDQACYDVDDEGKTWRRVEAGPAVPTPDGPAEPGTGARVPSSDNVHPVVEEDTQTVDVDKIDGRWVWKRDVKDGEVARIPIECYRDLARDGSGVACAELLEAVRCHVESLRCHVESLHPLAEGREFAAWFAKLHLRVERLEQAAHRLEKP